MSAPSADELSQINRLQSEKIKKLANLRKKVQQTSKKSMLSHSPLPPYSPSNHSTSGINDTLKQYYSVKSSEPEHDYREDRQKSTQFNDYGSALFRQIREDDLSDPIDQNEAHSQFTHTGLNDNYSSISNGVSDSDNLLNKIDQILEQRQKRTKSNINMVYEQYLEKSSLSNSSLTNRPEPEPRRDYHSKTHSSGSGFAKMRTITEEEKATLTIERDEDSTPKPKNKARADYKSKTMQFEKNTPHSKRPPLPTIGTIERQEKRLQQMMQVMKEDSAHKDKEQIMFDLSDDESEAEQDRAKQQSQKADRQPHHKKDDEEQQKRKRQDEEAERKKERGKQRAQIEKEKAGLMEELEAVEEELRRLEEQEDEDSDF